MTYCAGDEFSEPGFQWWFNSSPKVVIGDYEADSLVGLRDEVRKGVAELGKWYGEISTLEI